MLLLTEFVECTMTAQENRLSLLVEGSVNMDLVMQLDRAPQGGETLLVEPGGQNRIVEFPGANMAIRDLVFSLPHGLEILDG